MTSNRHPMPTEFPELNRRYQQVITGDSSFSLWSESLQEGFHSEAGALAETRYIYIEGCQIKELFEQHAQVNILEVGLGLGTGYAALKEVLSRPEFKQKKIQLISLEIDEDLIAYAQSVNHLPPLTKETRNGCTYYAGKQENIALTIVVGDARTTLDSAYRAGLIPPLHAVFQDPFSPKKNAFLWTKEWFLNIKQYCLPFVRLSTYSASTSIRKALHAAGFKVFKRQGFSGKKHSTTAMLMGEMDQEFLSFLEKSPIPVLCDKDAPFYV